jgi:hypothetical protein
MTSLLIEETAYTPKVQFESDGNLSLVGKSLPEDTIKFYQPLVDWIAESNLPKLNITVRLDYMNSSSAHHISKLLLTAKDNPNLKECYVEWYYESDDEDSLDFGKELEYLTDFKFKFYRYAEAEI